MVDQQYYKYTKYTDWIEKNFTYVDQVSIQVNETNKDKTLIIIGKDHPDTIREILENIVAIVFGLTFYDRRFSFEHMFYINDIAGTDNSRVSYIETERVVAYTSGLQPFEYMIPFFETQIVNKKGDPDAIRRWDTLKSRR